MSVDKTAKDFLNAFQKKNQPEAFDTSATVTRVEEDTLWVHIPGGVDETPVKRTVGASVGDEIQVRVGGGRAWAVGNASAPPTDDTQANIATGMASQALKDASAARNAAVIAESAAESAQNSANIAQTAAEQAVTDAATAQAAAERAEEKADDAATAASNAQTSADEAMTSASTANTAANSALTQLSVVEDVVGTLNWISEHGVYAATTDTEVVHGKLYFTRSGSGTDEDPYVYNVVASPASDPSAAGYYELVSVDEAVSNYVSTHLALTEEGLYVVSDANGWKVLIKNDGVYIMDPSGVIVAQYKDAIMIGKSNQSKVQIDYHSLQLVDKEGNSYFYVSDLRDANGDYAATDFFTGDGTTTSFGLNMYSGGNVEVTINGNAVSGYIISGKSLILTAAPANGANIQATYNTRVRYAKAYTFGERGSGQIGGRSVVEGSNNVAGGYASHAEGVNTVANGSYSHTEGYETNASGNTASHAEGYDTNASGNYGSHAEGYGTTASGNSSHAEGDHTTASGTYSHAEGLFTTAASTYQHVSGKYNVADINNAYAEIIGNGASNSARSNARTLDWSGNEVLAGGLTINGSTNVAKAIKSITRSGTTFTYTCLDGTTGTFTQQDNDTLYAVASTSSAGLLRALNGSTSNFMRGDGTWATPPNTWRGIQNNLTSTSTTDSLSAYQGKLLNDKFASYLPLSGGTLTGGLTVGGSSKSGGISVAVVNNKNQVSLTTNSNAGVYSSKFSKWLIYINTSGTVTANTSDRRYKNDLGFTPEDEVLTILRGVDINNFTYKGDENEVVQNGIYAQQLRDVLIDNGIGYRPYLTIESIDPEDTDTYYDLEMPEDNIRYGIDYGRMTPIVWKGWQIHDRRLDELERANAELRKEIEELKSRL